MSTSRRRNRRGEGARLRAEIVAAAGAVLEGSGSEDAVTLRAVARQVGIAAPSIYGHFTDRDQMLLAVIAEAFTELDEALAAAAAAAATRPGDELPAVCAAYVQFARDRPGRYRVMFGRHRAAGGGAVNQPRPDAGELVGADAFFRLVQAVARHRGGGDVHGDAAGDPPVQDDAIALWIALHGYVSLRDSVPAFPWPPEQVLLKGLIGRLTKPA